jgi:hypothetical protein
VGGGGGAGVALVLLRSRRRAQSSSGGLGDACEIAGRAVGDLRRETRKLLGDR